MTSSRTFTVSCDRCKKENENLTFTNEGYFCQQCIENISKQNFFKKIPQRWKDKSFENFKVGHNREIFDYLKNWNNKNLGVYLFGKCGTGKTHLLFAFIIKNWKIFTHYSWLPIVQIPQILSEFKVCFDIRMVNKYKLSPILIIDDFGIEKVTDWSLEQIYLIIDYRYQHCLPTFFSSNCSLGEAGKRFNLRIASRICEMCNVFEIIGVDNRIANVVKK